MPVMEPPPPVVAPNPTRRRQEPQVDPDADPDRFREFVIPNKPDHRETDPNRN